MGLFSFLKNLFVPSLDAKLETISRRIYELRCQRHHKPHKTTGVNAKDFEIDAKSFSNEVQIFEPRSFDLLTSMRSLKEKRIELENQRIAKLREQINLNFNSIKSLIDNEEADRAGNLLVETYSAIKEVNDTELLNSFSEFLSRVKSLKEKILQQEIERKRKQKEREEEERRKRELAKQEKKAKLEQARLRKEREAREYEERLRSEALQKELERKRLIETVTRKKSDSERFLDYLRRKGITCFYHFTDENNLASIRLHGGLFSWFYCENHNIKIPNAGGSSQSRSLDCRHGLQDYVRLSFCLDHPMQWRLMQKGTKLVLLKIKVDVATFKDTQFSNINAADNNAQHGPSFEDLERVNIYAVKSTFVRKDDDIFHEHQAECMVKTFIPIEYITNIDHPQRL